MSHIFTKYGEGDSDRSLTKAISNAFGDALESHDFGGDHLFSTTIIIEGYHFDGETYRVKIRVIIVDHQLAQEDLLKEITGSQKEATDNDEMQKNLIEEHYLAMHLYHHSFDKNTHFYGLMHDMAEYHGSFEHLGDVTVIATEPVHHLVAKESGFEPILNPIYRQAHVDLATPTLGPGSPTESDKSDKIA
jgi:hypothetical protein